MTEPNDTPHLEQPTEPAPKGASPWYRLPYLVLFVIVFEIVKWLVFLTALVQFLLRVITGRPNERLQRFGGTLGSYLREVVAYLAYTSDVVPYPFGPWPRA